MDFEDELKVILPELRKLLYPITLDYEFRAPAVTGSFRLTHVLGGILTIHKINVAIIARNGAPRAAVYFMNVVKSKGWPA